MYGIYLNYIPFTVNGGLKSRPIHPYAHWFIYLSVVAIYSKGSEIWNRVDWGHHDLGSNGLTGSSSWLQVFLPRFFCCDFLKNNSNIKIPMSITKHMELKIVQIISLWGMLFEFFFFFLKIVKSSKVSTNE